jgi:type I restriction enzyme S subunit
MFASITGKNLKEFKVLLPPLPEQKRIVDLISSVDSYIEALQQQLENVKKSRNAVLHELLTEGGDNWVETTLGETADLVRGPFGGSLKKEIFVQEGFAVYEQQHAIYGDFSNIRYRISTKKFDEMKRFSLLPGDLIMSCSGTMGKVRIVPEEAAPGIINQALLKIKPRSNLSGAFLFLWMQSDDFIRQIEMNSGGGALQNVSSVKMLKAIKLAVPELAIQDRVIKIISTIDEVKIKTELAIGAAKKLRSGLLSDLLNGEHEIPSNYDKVMGAA